MNRLFWTIVGTALVPTLLVFIMAPPGVLKAAAASYAVLITLGVGLLWVFFHAWGGE